MTKRILAVGHDAYRAGAQIAFLHVLRWLRANYPADISLLLSSGGALLDDYSDVLPTEVLPERRGTDSGPGRPTLSQRAGRRLRPRRERLEPGSIDLVLSNSAASAGLAANLAAEAACPAICHVHELDMAIRRFIGPERFGAAAERLDGFVAVSRAVEQNLVANYGIDAEKIVMIHEGIPLPQRPAVDAVERLRVETGIPLDAFVVGGCGTVDWRKGPDLFLLVAKAVEARVRNRPVRFVWVGGEPGGLETMRYDLDRLGLGDTAILLGQHPDAVRFFSVFDAFFLSSREDPFPLVALEAAALGVPIVCFADAGGMPELVGDDAGLVVGYLDLSAAADALALLAGSEPRRVALGRRAADKVAGQCSIDVIGPQIAAVLDRHLGLPGAST